MTSDAKLLTAAAEIGRDQVLPDPSDADILLYTEELADVRISERWRDRQERGILMAFDRGSKLGPEDDVAPVVRSVASIWGLA